MRTVTTGMSPGVVFALLVFASCATPNGPQSQDASSTPSPAPWTETGVIKAADPIAGEQFGYSITLSGDGDTLVAGTPMHSGSSTGIRILNPDPDDVSSFSSGAVYVYARGDEGWSQQSFIKASNTGLNDQFASAVAISEDGNTLAVSAPFEDSGATGIDGNQGDNSVNQSGAVYIFSRSGTSWSQQAYVKASNTGEASDGDTFGYTIALADDGQTLAVGAPSEDSAGIGINSDQSDNSAMAAGAVYVFSRDDNSWSQQAYLKSSNTTTNTLFGYSVALSQDGNTLAAGVYDEDGGRGAVYVFNREENTWSQQARLQSSNREGGDSMGSWVTISDDGNTVAAGSADEDSFLTGVNPPSAGGDDQVTNTSAGAAYVFARSGNQWSQQAYIKASNTGREDWFSVQLALSGDGNTLASSAPNEDSAGQGIGAQQTDDSADEAGAVYLYTRNGNTWTHQVYIKGSNTEQFDEFGGSVAMNRDGTMLAVGARFEDSSRMGTNGDETDNSSPDSGAIYLFSR
jgi:hypothetical protein